MEKVFGSFGPEGWVEAAALAADGVFDRAALENLGRYLAHLR